MTDRLGRPGRCYAESVRVRVGQRRAGRVLRQDRVDRYGTTRESQVEQVVGDRAQEPGTVMMRYRRGGLQDARLIDQPYYTARAQNIVPASEKNV